MGDGPLSGHKLIRFLRGSCPATHFLNVSLFLSSREFPMTLSPQCYINLLYLHHNNSQPPDYTTLELRMAVSTGGYLGIDYSGFGCQREDIYIWVPFCLIKKFLDVSSGKTLIPLSWNVLIGDNSRG